MSAPKSARDQVVTILAFAFFAVFLSFLAYRYYFSAPEMPVVDLQLKDGDVLIELRPDLAPQHVERILTLASEGFYDGIVFHRVIEGFMAQTGDPTGTGMGASELPDLPAEFSDEPFVRGTLGMARSASPDSANSQFFIVTADSQHLNGQYTLFGHVIEGMEYVDNIKQGAPRNNGLVEDPDHIVAMTVVDSETE